MSKVTRGRIWNTALVLGSMSFLITPSLAVNFPYSYHSGQKEIDQHQLGEVNVTVNSNGSAVVTAKFSNGKKIAGNTFAAATGFYGKDSSPFLVVVQTKGLDGSLLYNGKTQEGEDTQTIHLTPDQLAAFDHAQLISVKALCDGIDFSANCFSVEKVKVWLGPAIEIGKVIFAGTSPQG